MSVFTPGLEATGNISPCRICVMDGEFGVAQATGGTAMPCGISGPETRYAPGTAFDDGFIAQSGDDCKVYTTGSGAMVEAGNSITGGNFVMADANGRAIPVTTGKYHVGEALESATASGQRIRVRIDPGYTA